MGNRYNRKHRSKVQSRRSKVEGEGPRMIACGKINKHGRETWIAFESMGKLSQGAVRRVFGENTARAEEIINT